MKNTTLYIFFACGIVGMCTCFACSLSFPKRIALQTEPSLSEISIPVRMERSTLRQLIEANLPDTLYSQDEGWKISVERHGQPHLSLQDYAADYGMGLYFKATKKVAFTHLHAQGVLWVDMRSDFDILPNWQLSSQTQIVDHHWIQKPKAGIGGIRIPVKWLTNLIFNRVKDRIATQIDQVLAEKVDLQGMANELSKELLQDRLLDDRMQLWLSIHPQTLFLAPIASSQDAYVTQIGVETHLELLTAQPEEHPVSKPLPKLALSQMQSTPKVALRIPVSLSYAALQAMATDKMKGQSFEKAGQDISISEMRLYPLKDGFVGATVMLVGSINGVVDLAMRPTLVQQNRVLDFEDIQFKFRSQNFLAKALAGIAKGFIRKQIDKQLRIDLSDTLETMKDTLNEKLTQQAPDQLFLSGAFEEISISDLEATAHGLQFLAHSAGQFEVRYQP